MKQLNGGKSRYFATAAEMDKALIDLLEKKDFEYITVKEICQKAGVNRSTFYLHYETVADLLNECIEYAHKKLIEKYAITKDEFEGRMRSANNDDIIFITPEYLRPYFEFIKENKAVFKVFLLRSALMNAEKTFDKMFKYIFSPILDRFNITDLEKTYMMRFYISGITAIATQWLKGDCADDVDDIVRICMRCILPSGREDYAGGGTQ